jgi:hypothetical protein
MQRFFNKSGGAVGYGCTGSTSNRPIIPQQPPDMPLEIKQWLDDATGVEPLCEKESEQ